MISKIISGGQTGVDQAALDVAIENGISHGGWIPKGRLTENGPLVETYKLQEMPTDSYPARTEKNVIESDGTLIVSHGRLTGGSALTQEAAAKHKRPHLHIDLLKTNGFKAAQAISVWIADNGIRVLNVAGPRASKDPKIYDAVKKVLTTVLLLDHVHSNMPDPESAIPGLPRTVDEAVTRLVSELTIKDKAFIARMKEDELPHLHPSLGRYVRDRFGLWAENKQLLQSCRLRSDRDLRDDEASTVIIEELWKTLRETHALRVIK